MNNLWRVAKLLPIGGALWYLKDPIRRQRVLDFDFKQNEVLRAPAGIDMGKGHEEPSVHVKLIKTSPLILSVLRDSPLSSLNMGSNDDPRLLDQEPIDPMVPIEEVFPPPVRENEDDRVFEDEPHFGPTAPMEDELDDSVAEGAGVGAARTGGQGASLAEAVDECSPENKPSTSKVSPDTDDEASASEDANERILTRKRGRRNSPTDLIGNPRQNLEARESDDDESSGPE